jgi:tetratricopeptide (TPR) repeat protein
VTEEPAAEFLPRDQDAYASFRGYKYQVDATIERWLRLADDEHLELECGEDIDEVNTALAHRTLTQIKHREKSLTLRSLEAVSALANFVVQRKSNPAIKLSYRYLTNASVVNEREPPTIPGGSAITAWNSLRVVPKALKSEPSLELQAIKEIVLNAPRPGGYSVPAWNKFVTFRDSASDGDWLELIGAVEWSVGALGAGDLEADVVSRLVHHGMAQDHTSSADIVYPKLFVHLMRKLSRPGPKRIDAAELRASLTQLTSSKEGETLLYVRAVFVEHERRIADLETDVYQLKTDVVQHGLHLERHEALLKSVASTPLLEEQLELRASAWDARRDPPSTLLRAQHRVVPFRDRERELGDLEFWCTTHKRVRVRLYTGDGGIGKTRLLSEFCSLRQGHGWTAGFLSRDASVQQERVNWTAALSASGPTIIVVDYAETRDATLRFILKAAYEAAASDGPPIRIVLLARGLGDWWERLKGGPDGVGSLLEGPLTDATSLAPSLKQPASRREAFLEAAKHFALALSMSTPSNIPSTLDLDSQPFDRVLFVHLAALLVVLGITPQSVGAEASHDDVGTAALLLDGLLTREKFQWRERLVGIGVEFAKDEIVRGLTRTMARVTLGQPAGTLGEAVALLSSDPALGDLSTAAHNALARTLHELYGRRYWIDPIEPDLLGERLIQRAIEDEGHIILSTTFAAERSPETRTAAFVVLSRLARWQPVGGVALLHQALEDRLQWLIFDAIEASIQTGGPLGDVLAQQLESFPDSVVAHKIADLVLSNATSLGVLNVVALRQAVESAREAGDRESLARYLSNLGNRLLYIGERDEAINVSEEAARIEWTQLAEYGGNEHTLAVALNNLGGVYRAAGHFDEALHAFQEAVRFFVSHGELEPGLAAMAYQNYGLILGTFGRNDEAVLVLGRAVAEYLRLRILKLRHVEDGLIHARMNLATALARSDRFDLSRRVGYRAIQTVRDLSNTNPDVYEPQLAHHLATMSVIENAVKDFGLSEHLGEESIAIYSALESRFPGRFMEGLSLALHNQSKILFERGRNDEAHRVCVRAAQLRRTLASNHPRRFVPLLSTTLAALATIEAKRGNMSLAVNLACESVSVITPWFEETPTVYANAAIAAAFNYSKVCEEVAVVSNMDMLNPIFKWLADLPEDEQERQLKATMGLSSTGTAF